MITRLMKIRREFGIRSFLTVVLSFLVLTGIAIAGIVAYENYYAAVIAVLGLVVGFMLRQRITDYVSYLHIAVRIAVVAFMVILIVGESVGIEDEVLLPLISLFAVIVFDLYFWGLSDPLVFKLKETRDKHTMYD